MDAGHCVQAGDLEAATYSLEEKPHTSPDGEIFHLIVHSTGLLSTSYVSASSSGAVDTKQAKSSAFMEVFFQ